MPADAAWCTLCFAQLRPPAATPAPTAAAPPAAAVPEPVAPLLPVAPEPLLAAPLAPEPFAMPLTAAVTAPVFSVPVGMSAPTALVEHPAPTWPCSGCDEQVALDAMTCSRCGTAFMGGINPNVSLKVPVVGELVGMSAGAKFGVMAGGTAVLTTLLVLLLLVLGHIF